MDREYFKLAYYIFNLKKQGSLKKYQTARYNDTDIKYGIEFSYS